MEKLTQETENQAEKSVAQHNEAFIAKELLSTDFELNDQINFWAHEHLIQHALDYEVSQMQMLNPA